MKQLCYKFSNTSSTVSINGYVSIPLYPGRQSVTCIFLLAWKYKCSTLCDQRFSPIVTPPHIWPRTHWHSGSPSSLPWHADGPQSQGHGDFLWPVRQKVCQACPIRHSVCPPATSTNHMAPDWEGWVVALDHPRKPHAQTNKQTELTRVVDHTSSVDNKPVSEDSDRKVCLMKNLPLKVFLVTEKV